MFRRDLVLNMLSAVKLEKARVGFGYRLVDYNNIGRSEKEMSITDCDKFFKSYGIKTPPRRKDGDVFFLEVEYGAVGLFVMIPVSEELYNEQVEKFISEYTVVYA